MRISAGVQTCALPISGRRLFDAIPELAGTLAESYLRHAAASRDVRLFEMPSPFRKDAWLQCRRPPVGDGVALLLRDIGPDMRGDSGNDAKLSSISTATSSTLIKSTKTHNRIQQRREEVGQ